MPIEKANPDCLAAIEAMTAACIVRMREAAIEQWDEIYPTIDVFRRDCEDGNLFVLRNSRGRWIGCGTLDQKQSAPYQELSWAFNTPPIGVVHRLMISPEFQGKGYAKALMQDLEDEARQRGYQSIRLDAYQLNPAALRLYAVLGYRRSGQVQFRKGVFDCFEKELCV